MIVALLQAHGFIKEEGPDARRRRRIIVVLLRSAPHRSSWSPRLPARQPSPGGSASNPILQEPASFYGADSRGADFWPPEAGGAS